MRMGRAALLCLMGVGAGVLSAWGVGGGSLLLLGLTLGCSVEAEAARGITLLFFLASAGTGLWFHRREGQISAPHVKRALLPGLAGAAAGTLLSLWTDPAALERAFGVFLLAEGALSLFHRKTPK